MGGGGAAVGPEPSWQPSRSTRPRPRCTTPHRTMSPPTPTFLQHANDGGGHVPVLAVAGLVLPGPVVAEAATKAATTTVPTTAATKAAAPAPAATVAATPTATTSKLPPSKATYKKQMGVRASSTTTPGDEWPKTMRAVTRL